MLGMPNQQTQLSWIWEILPEKRWTESILEGKSQYKVPRLASLPKYFDSDGCYDLLYGCTFFIKKLTFLGHFGPFSKGQPH